MIFDRFSGVKPNVTGEGTHFLIPWVQRPIIFDIRSTPRVVTTITGSKGKHLRIFLFSYSRLAKRLDHVAYLASTRAIAVAEDLLEYRPRLRRTCSSFNH